jgi:hypothetical protein
MAVKMMFFGRSRSLRWVFWRDLTSGLGLGRCEGRSVSLRELGMDVK